jgi:RNA ligase
MKKELLLKMLDEKLVTVQKHPDADLFIYNYAARVQYDRLWNEVTLSTRGLILDQQMNYVARPFGKFFNIEEVENELPNEPFEVFEKLDGSLGILYWINDKPFIATRGSFTSEQALHGSEILHSKYSHTFDKLDKRKTYLFEIIYPGNRIVIDYGNLDDLILLTVIDNNTGLDISVPEIGFPFVKRYDGINDLPQLKKLEEDNKEGFVLRFKSGFRVKVKFQEYVKLHRIITGISNLVIWEHLSQGKSFEDILERVPDEFYNWVKQTQKDLVDKYNEIYNESKSVFKEFETRKETALYFQKQNYPHVLFRMLDGKTPEKVIWKMLRPVYSKPFKIDEG